VTDVHVTLGTAGGEAPSYAVTAVQLSQAAAHDPLMLRFAMSSLPLIEGIQGEDVTGIPVLTLSVRAAKGGHPLATALTYSFSGLSVGSFAENSSGSLSGTAKLAVRPR
jgi:hypothetical protein